MLSSDWIDLILLGLEGWQKRLCSLSMLILLYIYIICIYIYVYIRIYIYYTVCFRCPLQLKGRSLGTPDSGETPKVRHQCALLQNQALLSRVGSCILQNQEPSVESSDLLRLSTFMHATKSNSQLVNASMISTCDVQFPERFWWNLCLSRFCRVFFVDFVAWVYFFALQVLQDPLKSLVPVFSGSEISKQKSLWHL